MPELGVITREEEAQIAQIIDDLIDFTKFKGFVFKIIELLDGKIFLEGISYLDNTLGEKIPEDFKPLVKAFILAVIAADAVAIVETGTELINVLVDIPNITEDNEARYTIPIQ